MKKIILLSVFVLAALLINAQKVGMSPEYIKSITPDWTGERFVDGRPKVSDDLLERLKEISVEEAWGYLRNKGFHNQFENGWLILKPEQVMTGRVVTALRDRRSQRG
jgi:4-hydroxy-4-methyl-2-oxoglutarate aldolase